MKKLIKKVVVKIRDYAVQRKIWLMRATSYMGVANSILLILVFLKVDENPFLDKWVVPLIIGWVLFLVGLGYVEAEIFKNPQAETMKQLKLNKPQEFIYNKVGENNKKIKSIELELKEIKELLNEKHI